MLECAIAKELTHDVFAQDLISMLIRLSFEGHVCLDLDKYKEEERIVILEQIARCPKELISYTGLNEIKPLYFMNGLRVELGKGASHKIFDPAR